MPLRLWKRATKCPSRRKHRPKAQGSTRLAATYASRAHILSSSRRTSASESGEFHLSYRTAHYAHWPQSIFHGLHQLYGLHKLPEHPYRPLSPAGSPPSRSDAWSQQFRRRNVQVSKCRMSHPANVAPPFAALPKKRGKRRNLHRYTSCSQLPFVTIGTD